MADEVQITARALGGATRYELFRRIAEAGAPVGVAELAEALGLHHNAVRQHLAKLVEAGLVEEQAEPRTRPGRPRLLYTARADAVERWAEVPPYQRLALLLTEVIAGGDPPLAVGRRAGRRIPVDAELPPLERIVVEFTRQGFEPSVRQNDEGETVISLGNCPFAEAATVDPELICDLHHGLAQGMASATGGIRVTGLEPRDPRRAGCTLRIEQRPARRRRTQ